MSKQQNNKKSIWNKQTAIILIAFVAVVALAVGIYFWTRPKAEDGMKTVTVTVVHGNGEEHTVTVKTDKKYLAEVMIDAGMLDKAHDENGIYNTVDGETAKWDVDQSWWAVYDGEVQTNEGLNTLPVSDGGKYKVVYTIGFEGF